MMWIVAASIALITGFGMAVALTPRRVEYVEHTDINANPQSVYNAVRRQETLMQWSAWPAETGSDCRVEGADGVVGAQLVYLDKRGRVFGRQEVLSLEENRLVSLSVESKGPPQATRLTILLTPIDEGRTRALLHFENRIAPPFHLILRLAGVVRWTREMHAKDLAGLKRWCETAQPTARADAT